jgi:2,5-furandicarboxylate decarboxylase 1
MLPKDFRGYLDYLDENGKLLRVQQGVDVKHEIAAGIRKVADNDGPALLFENVKGHPGWRVAGGLYATKQLMALALETEPDERRLLQRYLDCDEKRVKPKLVSAGPVKEIILKGDEVDLSALPIPTYSEKDVGPYLIPTADIARHPDTGIQNVTIDRRMVLSRNRTALDAAPAKHMGMIVAAGEKRGEGVGVAAVIGAPPELAIASQFRMPLGVDETEIAGAIRGEPIEIVKCETIEVDVPAHAEIVIEGVTMPGERVVDGPFGDYRGMYAWSDGSVGGSCLVVEITAITMRENPIFQAVGCGMPRTEDHYLEKWALTAAAYRVLCGLAPSPDYIAGLSFSQAATPHCLVVSIRKWHERAGLDVIYTLLSHYLTLKCVIVVDDDIDVYEPSDVEWAWVTRVEPNKDVVLLRGDSHSGMDTYRWGMDATVPLSNREWYAKAVPPGVDKVSFV